MRVYKSINYRVIHSTALSEKNNKGTIYIIEAQATKDIVNLQVKCV